MGNSCQIPSKNGRPSKLYSDVRKRTGSTSAALLIWALCDSPQFKKKYAKELENRKNLTSQGEPNLAFLEDIINFDALKLKVTDVKEGEQVLKAKDPDSGNIIYYNTETEIIDDVIKFNNENRNIKAIIAKNQKGYYIIVEPLSYENFNANYKIQHDKKFAEIINDFFEKHGIESPVSMNTFDVSSFMNALWDITKNKSIKNEVAFQYIYLLSKDRPEMQDIISRIINRYKGQLTEEELAELEEIRRNRFNNILKSFKESVDMGRPIDALNYLYTIQSLYSKEYKDGKAWFDEIIGNNTWLNEYKIEDPLGQQIGTFKDVVVSNKDSYEDIDTSDYFISKVNKPVIKDSNGNTIQQGEVEISEIMPEIDPELTDPMGMLEDDFLILKEVLIDKQTKAEEKFGHSQGDIAIDNLRSVFINRFNNMINEIKFFDIVNDATEDFYKNNPNSFLGIIKESELAEHIEKCEQKYMWNMKRISHMISTATSSLELLKEFQTRVEIDKQSKDKTNTAKAVTESRLDERLDFKRQNLNFIGGLIDGLAAISNLIFGNSSSENMDRTSIEDSPLYTVAIENRKLNELKLYLDKFENSKGLDKIENARVIAKMCLDLYNFIDGYKPIIERCERLRTEINNEKFDISDDYTPQMNEALEMLENIAKSLSDELGNMKQMADGVLQKINEVFLIDFGNNGKDSVTMMDGTVINLREALKDNMDKNTLFATLFLSQSESGNLGNSMTYRAISKVLNQGKEDTIAFNDIMRGVDSAVGHNTSFMYEVNNEGGVTGNWISAIDTKEFFKRKAEAREKGKSEYSQWIYNNTETASVVSIAGKYKDKLIERIKNIRKEVYGNRVDEIDYEKVMITIPSLKVYGKDSILDSLSEEQLDYWLTAKAIQIISLEETDLSSVNILLAPQVSRRDTSLIANAKNKITAISGVIKRSLKKNELDTEYGDETGNDDSLSTILDVNGIKKETVRQNGEIEKTIPKNYIRKINTEYLSTDATQALMTLNASSNINKGLMSIVDFVSCHKIYSAKILRETNKESGKEHGAVIDLNGEHILSLVKKVLPDAEFGLDYLIDKEFYGKSRIEGTKILGKISTDKLGDKISNMNSVLNLSTNILGAIANVAVGKLQMYIEGRCGEFFSLKDWGIAEAFYSKHLPEMMMEFSSNDTKSILKLLGDKFDVQGEFIRNITEDSRDDSPLKQMINRSSIMFLYGMGEHNLHYQTMIAILNHIKVINKKTGLEEPLLNVFKTKEIDAKNDKLIIDFDNYQIKDKETGELRDLNENDIDIAKRRIKYCNDKMHGAFNKEDRGLIHKWTLGRLLMNFRQWMPAHYSRRFKLEYFDGTLGEFREGMYITMFKFCWDCIKSLKEREFSIIGRYKDLTEAQKANLKRCMAELELLSVLTLSTVLMGDYKDKRGNWASRVLLYELLRMQQEVSASTPFSVMGMPKNFIQITNSPIPSLKTVQQLSEIFDIADLFNNVESGPHKGDNKYLYDLMSKVPMIRQFRYAISIADEDNLFKSF